MSKPILWSSDPTMPRDEREELARAAWMAAAEHLMPELVHDTSNARIAEINLLYRAFENWWQRQLNQVDQCPYVIADKSAGYRHCVLPKGHNGDHSGDYGDRSSTDEDRVAPGASWCTPEQLASRQRS